MTFEHDKTKIVPNGFGHKLKVLYVRQKTIELDQMVKVGVLCTDCKRVKIDGYEMIGPSKGGRQR